MAAALVLSPDALRRLRRYRARQEGGFETGGYSRQMPRLAIEIDDQSWPWHGSSEYETDCEQRELRGCLLPSEENSKVEEYKYRQRNCPLAEKDCSILSTRIGELQKEKLSLRQHKNDLCRGLNLNGDHGNNCRYAIRRVVAVIDAITAAETSFEEQCFE